MQYHAIPCNSMQYRAIPCNTMQYYAIQCNTMQYHASLITADGAYHCPVGSIMAIFTIHYWKNHCTWKNHCQCLFTFYVSRSCASSRSAQMFQLRSASKCQNSGEQSVSSTARPTGGPRSWESRVNRVRLPNARFLWGSWGWLTQHRSYFNFLCPVIDWCISL